MKKTEFITGEPCPKCGGTRRYVKGSCVTCHRESCKKAYRDKHPERRELQPAWHDNRVESNPLDQATTDLIVNFIERVKQYRLDESLSYESLAELCETNRATVYDFISGRREHATIRTALKISLATGVLLV
jgi:ribosome-binding protein aMBF1 (putative translation factor)